MRFIFHIISTLVLDMNQRYMLLNYLLLLNYITKYNVSTQNSMKKLVFALFNAKMARGWSIWPPPCGFPKNVSSKVRVNPCFFVTFNTIISHIFPENFIEIPQVIQNIWRISLSISAIFIDLNQFFWFYEIYLLQRN